MRIERSSRFIACGGWLLAFVSAAPLSATVAVPEARPAVAGQAPPAADPAARPFVPHADIKPRAATPLSAGLAGLDELVTGGNDAAAWKVRRVRFRDAVLAAMAQPVVIKIVVVGVGLIFAAAFVRRRRRRRIGWGVLPARSSMLPHRADPPP